MSEVNQSRETEALECPFCELKAQRVAKFDFVASISKGEEVLLTPDRAMLVPGHLLAITKSHLTSFAQLGRNMLREIDESLRGLEGTLAPVFGRYFRLEHGSDNITGNGAGACIDHAHIHLIPGDEDVGDNIQRQLPWQELERYEDLNEFKGYPYIYLGRLATHYVVPDPRLPGQWVRRQVAAVRGLEQWDWAIVDSTAELMETAYKLPVELKAEISVGKNRGEL